MHDPGVAIEGERLDDEVRLLQMQAYRITKLRRSRLISAEAKHVLGELCDLALIGEDNTDPTVGVRLFALAQACGMARARGSKCLTELERLGVVRLDARVGQAPRLPLRLAVTVDWRKLAALLLRGDRDTIRKAPIDPVRGSRVA